MIAAVKDLKKCLILKPVCWRSPDVYLDEGTLQEKGWFYTDELLSKQNKEKSGSYWSKPTREALIQYGFYLRLNKKQVDELLMSAGYERLYPCDPADGVCSYFLDQMAAEENEYLSVYQFNGRRRVERRVITKLIKIKSVINRLSEQVGARINTYYAHKEINITLWEEGQLALEEAEALCSMGAEYRKYKEKKRIVDVKCPDGEWLKRLNLFWDSRKQQLSRVCTVRVPAFSSKVMEHKNGRWNIIEEVERVAREMGYVPEQSEKMIAMYPTSYMKEPYDYAELEEQLSQYGTFKRYGYLYQTRWFLNSKKYRKNLYYTTFPLTGETRISCEWNAQEGFSIRFVWDSEKSDEEKCYISESAEQFCEHLKGTGSLKDEDLLYQVWKLRNLFEEETEASSVKLPEFTTLSHMLFGRRRTQESFAGKKEKYYEYEVGDKVSAVQMALAAGNEEFLGKYLCLAGLWEYDMYEAYVPQDGERYERLDAFVIYLLKYRDALIRVWLENFMAGEGGMGRAVSAEEGMLMLEIEEQFPMIRLAMTINLDIQFVLCERSWQNEYEKRKSIYRFLEGMVYQVRFSPARWYKEYAEAEYFDQETGKLKKRRGKKKRV